MRLRPWCAAFTATVLLALPLAAADTGPAATLQLANAGKILKDIREAANIVAGEHGPKAIDDFLKTSLGEKGFSGLDLGKPILGYVLFDEKDAEKTKFVLLAPIAKEDDFLDFLKRCHLEPEEMKDAKGVYKLGSFDLPQGEKPQSFEVLMRIIGSTAYVGFNVKADALDPAKVFKPEQVLDPKETALLAYKQFNDRVSPEVLKSNLKNLDEVLGKLKEVIGDKTQAQAFIKSIEALTQAMVKMSLESKETGTRITLDTASGDLTIDTYYTPKAGTDLAKSVAARKPSTNQFAGIAGQETAAGLMLQMPVGLKEVRDLMVSGIDAFDENIQKDDPPPANMKELYEATLKGLKRTIQSGNWDGAAAMNGPDKDGHFTFVAAISFEDSRPIEKALKACAKDFPPMIFNAIKFDVDKIGELDMHAIDPPEGGEPEGYSRIFGDRKIYFVFGPKGIYIAIGNGAKDALKMAINGKPGAANPFDVLVNPKRLSQVIAAADPGTGTKAEKIMGNEDKTYSAYTLSISGGDALRIKFGLNLKILPRFMAMSYLEAFGG